LRQAYDYWQGQPGNYFPIRFRGHRYSRATERSLSQCGVHQPFPCQDPSQLNGPLFPMGVGALNPQMASPRFPFSHVPSEIPLSRTGTKVTHLQWGLPTSDDTLKVHVQTWRIPKWLSASGLTIGKQSTSPPTSLKHVTQGQLEASKGFLLNKTTQDGPLCVRLPAQQDSLTRRETTQSTIKEAY